MSATTASTKYGFTKVMSSGIGEGGVVESMASPGKISLMTVSMSIGTTARAEW